MLVELSGIWLVLLNAAAWVAVQLGVAYLCCRIPIERLDHRRWLFRTREWEQGGAVYQALLRIRKWKSLLPSGGRALGAGFSLAHVESRERGYLQRWAAESCRAELTHWLAMAPTALFVLWNPPVGLVANVVYAIAANVPCILVQRYNRPRVLAILERHADTGSAGAAAQGRARGQHKEANVTNKDDPFGRDAEGRTTLFYAAERGDMDKVRRIIFRLTGTGLMPQRLALLEIEDASGLTAADVAEQAGHKEIAELLRSEQVRMEYYG